MKKKRTPVRDWLTGTGAIAPSGRQVRRAVTKPVRKQARKVTRAAEKRFNERLGAPGAKRGTKSEPTSPWMALLRGKTSWTVGSTGPLKFAPHVTGHAGDDWGPDGQQLQACPACGHDLTAGP
jgi:hypothetical protein